MSTATPATSSELVFSIDAARRVFRAAVRALGTDRFGDVLPSRWTVKELDAAHRLMRDEIAQLTDEQVLANDSRLVAVVAGNSYGHYLEHAAELGMAE